MSVKRKPATKILAAKRKLARENLFSAAGSHEMYGHFQDPSYTHSAMALFKTFILKNDAKIQEGAQEFEELCNCVTDDPKSAPLIAAAVPTEHARVLRQRLHIAGLNQESRVSGRIIFTGRADEEVVKKLLAEHNGSVSVLEPAVIEPELLDRGDDRANADTNRDDNALSLHRLPENGGRFPLSILTSQEPSEAANTPPTDKAPVSNLNDRMDEIPKTTPSRNEVESDGMPNDRGSASLRLEPLNNSNLEVPLFRPARHHVAAVISAGLQAPTGDRPFGQREPLDRKLMGSSAISSSMPRLT